MRTYECMNVRCGYKTNWPVWQDSLQRIQDVETLEIEPVIERLALCPVCCQGMRIEPVRKETWPTWLNATLIAIAMLTVALVSYCLGGK